MVYKKIIGYKIIFSVAEENVVTSDWRYVAYGKA